MVSLVLVLLAGQVGGAEAPPEPAAPQTAYFAEGPFRSAQRLVAGGAHRQAVTLLRRLLRAHPDAPERPQARYLLGLSLIRIERYDEAAALFEQLAVSYPRLRDEHLFQRGRALYLWGSYLDAARVLAEVDPEGPQGREARRLRARALSRATDFERLARWLDDAAADRPLEPELQLLLAEARHRTRDVLGAYRGFREVWLEADEPEVAASALLKSAGLAFEDRPLMPEPERQVVRALSGALTQAGGRADERMAKLEERLGRAAPRGRLRAEVAFARGRFAAARRRFRTALEHYQRAERVARAEAVELRARVALARGRTEEWLGRTAPALKTYESIASRFADRPEAEEALFRASELQLRSRRYAEARARCEALLLDNPVSPYRRRCLWSIGWGYYRLGEYPRAREFFAALAKMELPTDLFVASRYWLARTEAQLGDLERASAGFIEVMRRQPLGYYAALADAQLVDRPEDPEEAPAAASAARAPRALVRAQEYARLGLRAQALAAARAYERAQREAGRRMPKAAFFALADLYEELGQRREARRVRQEGALEHPAALGSEAFLAAARRSMPIEHEEQIRAAARRHGVSEPLMFALVRTESGFRAQAVSNMNAYGLAQLILPTARAVAARIGAGRVTRRRLLADPAFNANLGAAYLRELLDLYEGSEPLALAAYNAGPRAVDAWMSRRVRRIANVRGRGLGVLPNADELAEEIPVAETRAFVKAVLARKRGYTILYGREEPEPEVTLESSSAAALAEPSALPAAPDPFASLPRGLHRTGRRFH